MPRGRPKSVLTTGFLFQTDEQTRTMYEQTMKEWQGCEAIVRQREREKHAEALARCSSGASVERGPVQRDSTISTDASLTFVKARHAAFWNNPGESMGRKLLIGFSGHVTVTQLTVVLSVSSSFQSSLSSSSDQHSTNSQSDSSSSAEVASHSIRTTIPALVSCVSLLIPTYCIEFTTSFQTKYQVFRWTDLSSPTFVQ